MDSIKHLIFAGCDKSEAELFQLIKDAVRKIYNYSIEHHYNEEGLHSIQHVHRVCLQALEKHEFNHVNTCINMLLCIDRYQESLRVQANALLRERIHVLAESKLDTATTSRTLRQIGEVTQRGGQAFPNSQVEYDTLHQILTELERF